MIQYVEHYRCGDAPCIHFDPAVTIAEMDYLLGMLPPRYPVPALIQTIDYVSGDHSSFVEIWTFDRGWNSKWLGYQVKG